MMRETVVANVSHNDEVYQKIVDITGIKVTSGKSPGSKETHTTIFLEGRLTNGTKVNYTISLNDIVFVSGGGTPKSKVTEAR